MLIKPNSAAANSIVATACGNCGMEDQLLLHNVRYRGSFRHLCTTCVLRLHPQAFCPTCFQVYPPPPPRGAVLTCVKCGSSTHSQCVAAPPKPYICPICVNPNACVFKLKKAEKGNVEGISLLMDRDAARKLLAAAKIVSASLNKEATAAKAEAERRAKEAVLTRKRAKEALEHFARLMAERKKENAPMALVKLPGYGEGGFRGSNLKSNPVIAGPKLNTPSAKICGTEAPHSTSMVENGGEIVEWSDNDIDQMFFSEEDNGAGNLDF